MTENHTKTRSLGLLIETVVAVTGFMRILKEEAERKTSLYQPQPDALLSLSGGAWTLLQACLELCIPSVEY